MDDYQHGNHLNENFAELLITKCPGYYCGRHDFGNGNISECGSCPPGTRVNSLYLCRPCTSSPSPYDWMYFVFMATLPFLFHAVYIDQMYIYKKITILMDAVLTFSALLEVLIAAVLAVLLVDPVGRLSIRSCRTRWLSDWYTVLYNPTPLYHETVRCTQEAVYPLYSIYFIFCFFCIIVLLTIRPLMCIYFGRNGWSCLKTVYAGLYFIPIMVAIHALLGGVIYFMFPYIVIVASVTSIGIHFASKPIQSVKYLIEDTVYEPRNIIIVGIHWICHGYGIVAITQYLYPPLAYNLWLLVPLPTIFYIMTTNFSEPSKIKNVCDSPPPDPINTE